MLDKLRRGKYSQQASLSLLRQPVEQCRQMLFAFMVQAQKEGLRNVLIVHGKGRDDQSHANIIRSYLARWLEELPEVQAFCAALPHHGGSAGSTRSIISRAVIWPACTPTLSAAWTCP